MRLAAYQCRALTGDIAANLHRLDRIARAASAAEADTLVVPELYLTGYCLGDRTSEFAMSPDAAALQEVSAIARRHAVALVVGYPELRAGAVYNTAALWDRSGALLSRYRKINLFGDEEKRLFRPGDATETTAIAGMSVGMLICYDVECPAAVRSLTDDGVQVILAPTANMLPYRAAAITAPRARALESGAALVYANYTGDEGPLTYTGLSVIVGADGEDRARAGEQGEALLIAEV